MKALFCTDGSKISYNALTNFINWFDNPTVDVLSVADLGVVPDNTSLEASEFAMYCTKSVDDILDYTEDIMAENKININRKNKMCGSVVDSILEMEDNSNYDLIILGSNGKKGIQKWLGSVSQEIASLSKTSVYISKTNNKSKRVLFTVDSTHESLNTVKKAIETLCLSDKEIYLATVYEMPEYVFLEGKLDNNWIDEIERQQQRASIALLKQIEKLFNEKGLEICSKSVLSGVPAAEIISHAQRMDIDLTVTGMRQRKYLSRFILGSVSKRILENVKSDIFIVKL